MHTRTRLRLAGEDYTCHIENTIHAPADDVAPPALRPAPVIISVSRDVPVSRVHEQPAAHGPPPSELLRRSAFRAGMATAFPVGRAAVARLDANEAHLEAVCACANALATLKPRFDEYVTTSQRIKTDEQRNAPCWKFMSREWNVLCAIAAARGHVGLDRDRIIATKACGESPLVSPADGTTFIPVSDGEEIIGALQGTYLHFCELLQRWIRSGSTSGKEDRGFAPRNKEHATEAELGGDAMRSNFYVNYRTTAANDAYPDLSPARGRWDKYVAIGFVRVEAESTVTLLQQLAQSLRNDVEEAKAKQNYATERVTAAEEELRLLSEGGAARPSRAGAPHVGVGADAVGHGVGGADASLGQEDNTCASSDQRQPRQKRKGGAVADNPTSGDLSAPRKSARIVAGPPSTTLSAAGRGRRGPHTSQQGAHASEPASSTVTAEPPASAATPEPARTTTTTTTTRAVAERRLNAASKLLATANAALDKLQQKSAKADRAAFAGQQSRSQAEAMCQLFNWASDSFEDALAGKTWNQRDLLQKKAGVIAYIFEALYDVLLSPAANVSRSPGFEKMLAGGGQ